MVALGFLNSVNASTPEAALSLSKDIDTPSAEKIAKTIILFHDKSMFQANDCERTQWGERGEHMLVPKSRGAGIMVSDFISEQDGYLKLSDQEFAIVERVHIVENDVLSKHGPFSSSAVHPRIIVGSKEHRENMEDMAEKIQGSICSGTFGKEQLLCYRGIKV